MLCTLVFVTGFAHGANPLVEVKTSLGSFQIELYPDKAPRTVENFLKYTADRFYDATIFHRVIPGFMVQGGGFTPNMEQKPTRGPVPNEAANGLKNDPGTVAMARTQDPHSATAQFFINVGGNDFLNHKAPNPQGFGYTVFGRVTKGMDVVNKIVGVQTTTRPPHENVPVKPVVIESVRVVTVN